MISGATGRIAFAASVVVAVAAAACGTIVELDVKYDSVGVTVDGGGGADSSISEVGRIIRDSSFVEPDAPPPLELDPSDGGPCEPDSDDGGGCDFSQGLGCCLLPAGGSRCIYQWEIAAKCLNGLFVGCRGDDPTSESACCWRDGPPGSNTRMSVLATSCDGGPHGCNIEAGRGCNEGICEPTTCDLDAGPFTIGICGPKMLCP